MEKKKKMRKLMTCPTSGRLATVGAVFWRCGYRLLVVHTQLDSPEESEPVVLSPCLLTYVLRGAGYRRSKTDLLRSFSGRNCSEKMSASRVVFVRMYVCACFNEKK